MARVTDIDPTHTCGRTVTLALLLSQVKPVDNTAIRSLNSDDSHQISISGRSVPHGGAAIPFEPHTQQTNHQLYPTALGIQGTNPKPLRT
jgi:hypothetical protein